MRERPYTKRAENGAIVIEFDRETTPEEKQWDVEFANECDALAEQEAEKTGKRRWGRWYLNPTRPISLDTKSPRPSIGKEPSYRGGIYDITLDRVDTHYKEHNYSWIYHMSQKNWVGEQGLADLRRAFDELIAEGRIRD